MPSESIWNLNTPSEFSFSMTQEVNSQRAHFNAANVTGRRLFSRSRCVCVARYVLRFFTPRFTFQRCVASGCVWFIFCRALSCLCAICVVDIP